MSSDDGNEIEGMRHAWPDVEPPAALDRAVRLQACRVLAQRRAVLTARDEGSYPAWLLTMTAVGLLAVLFFVASLPGAKLLWGAARRSVEGWPLAPAWLGLVASNLLAVFLAPGMALWRRSHAH